MNQDTKITEWLASEKSKRAIEEILLQLKESDKPFLRKEGIIKDSSYPVYFDELYKQNYRDLKFIKDTVASRVKRGYEEFLNLNKLPGVPLAFNLKVSFLDPISWIDKLDYCINNWIGGSNSTATYLIRSNRIILKNIDSCTSSRDRLTEVIAHEYSHCLQNKLLGISRFGDVFTEGLAEGLRRNIAGSEGYSERDSIKRVYKWILSTREGHGLNKIDKNKVMASYKENTNISDKEPDKYDFGRVYFLLLEKYDPKIYEKILKKDKSANLYPKLAVTS
jgi:hypothetical protein